MADSSFLRPGSGCYSSSRGGHLQFGCGDHNPSKTKVMSLRFTIRDLLWLTLAFFALVASGKPIVAQEDRADTRPASSQARERDEAAGNDAVDGWWAAALAGRNDRLAWLRQAKFGCFIHWGVYADLAGQYKGRKGGSYSEHIMRQLKIPRQEYLDEVAAKFNPEKFNADAWVKLIKSAGMRYL